MLHLVENTVNSIENNLLWVKHVRDSIFAWWFNLIVLVLVVGSFAYFLWSSHGTAIPDELKAVKFEPRLWNNAVRNVPITDYGQLPQTETGFNIQGVASGRGGTAF